MFFDSVLVLNHSVVIDLGQKKREKKKEKRYKKELRFSARVSAKLKKY